MFNNFLKRKIEEKEEPKPIGIAIFSTYTSCMGLGTSFAHPSTPFAGGPGFTALDFHPFFEVDDRVEDNIKVNGVWFKEKDVFLFKDKTSDELILFERKMKKRYSISEYGDIHKLYNDGLSVSYGIGGAENHFKNKTLKRKIDKDTQNLVKGES